MGRPKFWVKSSEGGAGFAFETLSAARTFARERFIAGRKVFSQRVSL